MRERALRLRVGGRGVGRRRNLICRCLFSGRVHADLAQVVIERPEQKNHTHNEYERCHKGKESRSTRKVSHVFYPSSVNYPASL